MIPYCMPFVLGTLYGGRCKILKACFLVAQILIGSTKQKKLFKNSYFVSGLGLARWGLQRQRRRRQGDSVHVGTVNMPSADHGAR